MPRRRPESEEELAARVDAMSPLEQAWRLLFAPFGPEGSLLLKRRWDHQRALDATPTLAFYQSEH